MELNAASELAEQLGEAEFVEAIVFGPWGLGSAPSDGEDWEPGYDEPSPPPVPFELRGKVLSLDEALPMMTGWKFRGGYGAPSCYAVRIWTNRRVGWVTQYDGSTGLCWANRNPSADMPDMPGG